MGTLELTQIHIQEERDSIEYATVSSAIDFLRLLVVKHRLPILDVFRIMANDSVDSVALTVNDPMVYLYVRRVEEMIHFRIKEGGRNIRFELPIREMRVLSHDLMAST